MNTSRRRWAPGRPTWMLAPLAAFALLLAGGAPAAAQGAACPEWTVPERQAQAANPIPAGEAALAGGREVYVRLCASCHGETGQKDGAASGLVNMSCARSLTDPELRKLSDGALYSKILQGRGVMPSTQNSLTDQERWMLVHYLRALASDAEPAGN